MASARAVRLALIGILSGQGVITGRGVDGDLVDTVLSERRDLAAAQAFFRSAKAATGVTPDRVTTDGQGSYSWAIRSTLGRRVVHRTSACRDSGLEQDHRGVKGRIRCMRGFKSFVSAERFCRSHDELRDFLRPRPGTTSMSQRASQPAAAAAGFTSAAPPPRSQSPWPRKPNSSPILRHRLWHER